MSINSDDSRGLFAGRRLAEQDIYTFLCRLLRMYRVEWPHDDVMKQYFNIILWPDKEPRFRFVRRSIESSGDQYC